MESITVIDRNKEEAKAYYNFDCLQVFRFEKVKGRKLFIKTIVIENNKLKKLSIRSKRLNNV